MTTATTVEPSAGPADFVSAWKKWHQQSEARLAAPHGFLSITSLHWLSGTPQRFDDAPGSWTTDEDGVHVVLDDDQQVTTGGAEIRGEHHFGVIPERGGVNVGWGDAVIEVAKRGGFDILRPRHPGNALRTAFAGTPAYEPDPRWAVPARYVAFDAPRPTQVGAAVEGLEHVYDAPGRVEFELDGLALSLTAFPGHVDGDLIVLFTDATSGVTTYGANRVLALKRPAADGAVVLDFNRAANLPCAYTDLATCPLPPAENRLPLAVEAGHKLPYERGGR